MSVTFLTDKDGCLITDQLTDTIVSAKYASKTKVRQLVSHILPVATGNGYSSIKLYHAAEHNESVSPSHTVSLQEAVYGGTMDWLTGKLTVTHDIFIPTGDDITNYGTASTGVPYVQFALPSRWDGANFSCSHYPTTSGTPTKSAARLVKPVGCYIYDTRFTDRNTAASLLNSEKPKIVYSLETPSTIQFDPITLEMLEGDNALWNNTGDTTVQYVIDTKTYVDERTSSSSGGAGVDEEARAGVTANAEGIAALSEEMANAATLERVNLIDKNNVIHGEYVERTNGRFAANVKFWRTDFVEIKPDTQYTLRYKNACAFYTEKDISTYVGGVAGYTETTDAEPSTFVTPSNAKYIVVCGHNNQLQTDQLEQGGEFTEYRNYSETEIPMSVMPRAVKELYQKGKYSHNLSSILKNAERTIKITLVGDSITHGVGGTGFEQDGEEIDGTGYYRNPNGYCWANLFKTHLESKYNCEVTNNACTGTNTQQLVSGIASGKLIHGDEDVVICMMGTNNRTAERSATFVTDMQQVYAYCKNNGILFIPMANIPATVADETRADADRTWHMEDVNAALNAFCVDNGIDYIDVFTPFYDYCLASGTSLETLLPDGLHPNDDGHYLIFRIVCKAIGIVAKIRDATW